MQVFSERLPIKSFKQDVSALVEYVNKCESKSITISSLLAPGTCAELEKITNKPIFYHPENSGYGNSYRGIGDNFHEVVCEVYDNRMWVKNSWLEKEIIRLRTEYALLDVHSRYFSDTVKYKFESENIDALLIAIGQAGSDPIVKLLTDAYCLHRFYSGEKEI